MPPAVVDGGRHTRGACGRLCQRGCRRRKQRGVAECGVGRPGKGGRGGGCPRVAVVTSACRPLGPDGRVGRAPLAGARAGRRPAVPCAVAAEQAAGGGEGGESRGGGGRPQAMGRVVTPPPGVAGGPAAADDCCRAGAVGVAASKPGGDALCLQGKVSLLHRIVCIVASL